MTARSLLLFAIPFFLGACSSDSFTAPEDGGGPDGAADSAAVDAVADTLSDVVAPPVDANGDSTTVDAGWKPPAPLACASAPADAIFCADFDTSNDPGADWSSVFKNNGDVLLNLTNFYSGARAAKTVANGNPPSQGVLYKNSIDTTHARFVLSFAFRVESVDTAAVVRVGRFEYPPATGPFGNVGFDLVVGPGTAVALAVSAPAGDAGSSVNQTYLGAYTKGSWHHVILDVKTKAPVTVDVSLDGSKQTFSPSIPGSGSQFGNRDIYLGARASTNMVSAATVQIDDVLLRAL